MTSHKKNIHEVIVLGGGLMGSAAAWQLSNQGKQVVLLEKQTLPYTQGSSKGTARITRSSNIEDNPLWSYLNERSVQETKGLVDFLNSTGMDTRMEHIYTTSPVSYIARQEELERLVVNLGQQEVPYELAADPQEGVSIFGVHLPEGTFLQREFQIHSGTFNPQKLIQLLHHAITLKGGTVRYGVEAIGIDEMEDTYRIAIRGSEAGTQELVSRQLVCAAGPYTGRLLERQAPYFQKLIRPQRVFLAFFALSGACWHGLHPTQQEQLKNGFPVIDRSPHEQTEEFFSMIEGYGPEGTPIIKTGGHFKRSPVTNPDSIWSQSLESQELEWSRSQLLRYLDILQLPIGADDLQLADQYSCIYSLTETEVPYVTPIHQDILGKDENFIVIAGLSGVGAKGSMAYGRIAANLLLGLTENDPVYRAVTGQLGYERLLKDLSDKAS